MNKTAILAALVLACGRAAAATWTPPENPDPRAIYLEAVVDRQGGHYEVALAKHLWFHENALSINPALAGVRLSFALSNWRALGTVYSPALARLKEVRDQTRVRISTGKDVARSFQDLDAINRELGEREASAEAFVELDRTNPKAAAQVFRMARASLVLTGSYALFAKYSKPAEDLDGMIRDFRYMQEVSVDMSPSGAGRAGFAEKQFTNSVATLVGVLVATGRIVEAQKISRAARAEWDEEAFGAALDEALRGVVPAPWP